MTSIAQINELNDNHLQTEFIVLPISKINKAADSYGIGTDYKSNNFMMAFEVLAIQKLVYANI